MRFRFNYLSLVLIVCAVASPMTSLAQEQTSNVDTLAPLLTVDGEWESTA
jgi:hypothetical protein